LCVREGPMPPLLQMTRTMNVQPHLAGSVVAFCGIARPHGFFAGLRSAGVNVVAERAFRDHHAYTLDDIQELQKLSVESGVAGFITTEKDQINLGALAEQLRPLTIAKLSLSVDDPNTLLDLVTKLVAGEAQAAKS
jgi:tetraacyldisaccharide 4'-kinase